MTASRLLIPACFLLVAACVSGCTSPITLPPAPEIAQPDPGTIPQLPDYLLQVGDVLDVKFPLNPELDEEVTVRPDGRISTAYATDVPAYGRTVAELDDELRSMYAAHLNRPQLSAVVRSFAPNRVYVAGEVNSPGEFLTVGPNLTVSQAIARAGGVKFSANRERVILIRRGAGDRPVDFNINYWDIITGRRPDEDIRLAQYDVLYVTRTPVGDAYQAVDQYILQFVPVGGSFGYTFVP